MPNLLCISVRFLQPMSHGRGDGGEPEWPPSPLRVFQALIAASAARWNERARLAYAAPALRWLERQSVPSIVAAVGERSQVKYRLYVPDNTGDLAAGTWSRGDATKIVKRTEKDIRPTHLKLGEGAVHYLWRLSDPNPEFEQHKEVLSAAARSITHLGWGIDMVAANASVITEADAKKLSGEHWRPSEGQSGTSLRVPVVGTLNALIDKHNSFLNRLGPEGFNPVPPLSAFQVVGYRRATDPPQRQYAAFTLLKPDAGGMRSFDTTRRTREVAGMLRSAVARVAHDQDRSNEWINVFVHGKTPDGLHPASGETSPDRFQYLPLPTINFGLGRVETIRRVLIAAPSHCGKDIAWVRRTLSGEELKNENGDSEALLTILPGSDWVLQQYIAPSRIWSSVTPVILPGHDDGNLDKASRLLKTAFVQAGYQKELLDQTVLEWRRVGFQAGVDLACRYWPPENLNHHPRYHVLVTFPHPISGPLVVGSGRFRGFGLFAAFGS